MNHAVVKFGEFAGVPTIGSANEVTCDTLKGIDVVAMAMRTLGKTVSGIFIAAVEAAVAIMVDGAVANVVFVHKVHNLHYSLRVMGCITIDLYIEDVTGILVLPKVFLSLFVNLPERPSAGVARNVKLCWNVSAKPLIFSAIWEMILSPSS